MRIALGSALFVLLASLSASAEEVEIKGLWDGFGVGSSVHMKTTSKTVIPGVESPDEAQETRQTLVKVTDDAWIVKTETKIGDQWHEAAEIPYPRKAEATPVEGQETPKPEELGEESVTVEGKEYSCKKTRLVHDGATTTSWVSEEHGLLKSETTLPGDGSTTTEVTALAKKVKVGGKDVTAREDKMVTKQTGVDMTVVSLSSDEVPGHIVRSETSGTMSGMSTKSVTEVVGFEVK